MFKIYNLAKPIKGFNFEQEFINSLVSCDDNEPDVHLIKKVDEIFAENDSARENLAKRSEPSTLVTMHFSSFLTGSIFCYTR